jgi:hypothetical protein
MGVKSYVKQNMIDPFGQYNLTSVLDWDEWSATHPIRWSTAKDSLSV